MDTEQIQDPTPLVARIVAELRGNSETEQMLLRAMLTNEFLGVPAGMHGIEEDVRGSRTDLAGPNPTSLF